MGFPLRSADIPFQAFVAMPLVARLALANMLPHVAVAAAKVAKTKVFLVYAHLLVLLAAAALRGLLWHCHALLQARGALHVAKKSVEGHSQQDGLAWRGGSLRMQHQRCPSQQHCGVHWSQANALGVREPLPHCRLLRDGEADNALASASYAPSTEPASRRYQRCGSLQTVGSDGVACSSSATARIQSKEQSRRLLLEHRSASKIQARAACLPGACAHVRSLAIAARALARSCADFPIPPRHS